MLAWLAAHLVARVFLPNRWRLDAADLTEIGGQTGERMDDVGATTERRGYVFVQAKHRLMLSQAVTSPLAEALDQAVGQFIDGAPQDPDGSRRPLDPGRDALVICTDSAASASVREDLATVVTRLASHPPEVPFNQVAKNERERRALTVLLVHLRAAFTSRVDGIPPSEEQLREISRLLHVVSLDLDPGGNDRLVAETHLSGVLDDPGTASGAWNDLIALGQALIEGQLWANRGSVRHALAMGGHPAGVDPPFRNDIQRLREVTAAVLGTNAPEVTIPAPEGAVSIHREVADLLAHTEGDFALIGEPGAGKTVLAAVVAAGLLEAGEDVVFLGAETLAGSLGATRTELGMLNNLDQVLSGWGGSRRGTLVVDGVDATRGTGSVDWLPQLARALHGTRWRVLASIRTFDLRCGPSWQQMFRGDPIDTGHADPSFPRVRHLLVGDLSDGELDQVRDQSPQLAALLGTADPCLLELLRNPFNLRLAAQLVHGDGDGAALAAVRTRQELLHLYWERRVELTPDHLARSRAIRDLGQSMVQRRRARVADPSSVVHPAVFSAVDALLHDGVLREDVQGRRAGAIPVVFSHPVLYDFAVAVTCLRGEDHLHLSQCLDNDPDLAITVRPSLDMHFADLWTGDTTRTSFWDLAAVLSEPNRGHPLAAIAAACAALREHPAHEDLVPIEGRAVPSDDASRAARMCVAHLAGALEAAKVSQLDRQASAPALAELAATLAAQSAATGDLGLGDLARVLLFRLDRCLPLNAGSVAAETRSRALADVMRCALTNPSEPAREDLAMKMGEALTRAAAASPGEVGPVIEEVIAPPVMAVWGGRVASRLIVQLCSLAAVAPDLAELLALSVWEFEEQRDEVTLIGNSNIIGLTSTRQQDLEMARFGTAQAFPAFLTAAPEAALRFFLAIVDGHAPSSEQLRAAGRLPRIYRSLDLQFASGHEGVGAMAHALVAFLVSSANANDPEVRATTDRLIKMLVQRLTHHQVWSYLLEAGATNPRSVGRRLLPLLNGSDLFGHYLATSSAARLVAALSPVLSAPEHAELEASVMRASDPFDQNGAHTQDLVDTLLGQLDPSRVQGTAARERLAELDGQGGPPPLPAPSVPSGGFRPSGVRERLAETNALGESDGSLLQAMERLQADLISTTSGGSDEQRSARQRLHGSLPALYSLLIPPDPAIGQPVFDEAFTLLVNGAELLATDPEVLPGTDLGEQVLGILTAAVPKGDSTGGGS